MDDNGDGDAIPLGAHLASLTSLRFFAAAAVLLLHIGQVIPPFRGARDLFGLGHVGVTFFFVLSGFVLTWTHRTGDTARLFYGRRFARVWPLHAVTTVAAAALVLGAGDSPRWWALPFVATLTHAFVPGAYYAFNTPSWSLGCEAFFYALFPIVVVAAGRARRPVRWAAGVVAGYTATAAAAVFVVAPAVQRVTGISANGIVGYGLNIFPGYRILEFAVGVLLATAVRRGWRSPVTLRGAVGFTIVVWLILELAGQVLGSGAADIEPYWVSVAMLGPLAALVASAATVDVSGGRVALLHRPLLVRLGKASFALYLVHFMVLVQLERSAGDSLPNWVLAVVGAAVALILAEAAHRLVETPLERALRVRIGARPQRVAEAAS